jgi:hypothetical protein
MTVPGKYDALTKFLSSQGKDKQTLQLSFRKIEEIIGDSLPESARKYSAWWANDAKTHPQGRSWVEAGWKVESVNIEKEEVVFKKV